MGYLLAGVHFPRLTGPSNVQFNGKRKPVSSLPKPPRRSNVIKDPITHQELSLIDNPSFVVALGPQLSCISLRPSGRYRRAAIAFQLGLPYKNPLPLCNFCKTHCCINLVIFS